MPREKEKDYDGYELKTIYEDMEMELIYSFYRNLTKHKKDEAQAGFSWEMWQVAMLRNIENYRKENRQIIGKHRQEVDEAISKVLKYAYDKGKHNVEQMAKQAQIKMNKGAISLPEHNKNTGEVNKIPPQENNFFGVNKRKLEAMIKTVQNDMERADQAIHRKMEDEYRQTIYNAKIQLANGAISLDKAIDIATENFLSKGINCIAYKDKDGSILRYVNIATYAEMALRTAQHRARLLGEGAKRDEMGRYLIFVSSHGNCCKLCFPWQGQVLIDDVYSHPSKEHMNKYKGKYKLLSEAIGTGLLHPNCRHTLATYFEGITRLPQIHDKKEALTNYGNEQTQRRLENKIRQAKRKLAGCVDDENRAKAKQHLMQCQKELRDFLKEHPEFKRHLHREKIYGVSQKITSSLDNFDDSYLQVTDKRTILEVDRALTEVYKEYPSLKGIISKVISIDQGTAYAEISIQNKGIAITLGINKSLTPENADAYTFKKYKTCELTKKPGIKGIIKHEMGHMLNYDYYMKKNKLEYNTPYGDGPLNKLMSDLKRNDFATDIRNEVFKRLGVADTPENVERYFSQYANNKSEIKNGDFFAEAFSDYSDTEAKAIFFEVLKERMK